MAAFAVEYAFALTDRYELLNEGPLALAWSWYNIVVLFLLCLICVEQPRLSGGGTLRRRQDGQCLHRRSPA